MIVVSNMRYFNAQGLAFEHRLEEQTINCALHHEQVVGLHGDVMCLCGYAQDVD
jgi:hypothetical protein